LVDPDHTGRRSRTGYRSKKGLGGLLHCGAGEAAHIADAACQRIELVVKRGPHGVQGQELAARDVWFCPSPRVRWVDP
jgi:hypothetical protein